MLMSVPEKGTTSQNRYSAEKLDEIMKDSKNQFIKVRDKWYQNRAMILSADRLNILISSKGTFSILNRK